MACRSDRLLHQQQCSGIARGLGVAARAIAVLVGLTYGITAHADPPDQTTPVTLTIENATGRTLRCQLVLAHFVTYDLKPIPASDTASLRLQRNPDGTLFFVDGARSMATENIMCGLDEDWTASRDDLDLRTLRVGSQPALRITCAASNVLICQVLHADVIDDKRKA